MGAIEINIIRKKIEGNKGGESKFEKMNKE